MKKTATTLALAGALVLAAPGVTWASEDLDLDLDLGVEVCVEVVAGTPAEYAFQKWQWASPLKKDLKVEANVGVAAYGKWKAHPKPGWWDDATVVGKVVLRSQQNHSSAWWRVVITKEAVPDSEREVPCPSPSPSPSPTVTPTPTPLPPTPVPTPSPQPPVAPSGTSSVSIPVEVVAAPDELPKTGTAGWVLFFFGLALLGTGLALRNRK